MPKNFYISDLHIGHENILRFDSRPFASTDEMLREITKRWNEVVSLNDYVYILGDFSFRCSPDVRNAAISVLHGRKILIRGNHDKGIPLMGAGLSLCAAARNGQRLMNVTDYMEIEDGGRKVVLSHYPMMAWNGSFHGSIHLYGHVHATTPEAVMLDRWKEEQAQKGNPVNMYNVGCMMPYMDYTPRTLDEIITLSRTG